MINYRELSLGIPISSLAAHSTSKICSSYYTAQHRKCLFIALSKDHSRLGKLLGQVSLTGWIWRRFGTGIQRDANNRGVLSFIYFFQADNDLQIESGQWPSNRLALPLKKELPETVMALRMKTRGSSLCSIAFISPKLRRQSSNG